MLPHPPDKTPPPEDPCGWCGGVVPASLGCSTWTEGDAEYTLRVARFDSPAAFFVEKMLFGSSSKPVPLYLQNGELSYGDKGRWIAKADELSTRTITSVPRIPFKGRRSRLPRAGTTGKTRESPVTASPG